jgi:hypothetical protein
MDPIVIWDLPDDPDGNAQNIAEHDLTPDEVEEVFHDQNNETDLSHSSGFPVTFGWTTTGRHTLPWFGKRQVTTPGWYVLFQRTMFPPRRRRR